MPVSKATLTEVPWVVVGCGYTGTSVAKSLVDAKAEVIVTRRNASALRNVGQQLGPQAIPRRVDLAQPDSVRGWMPPGAIVVDLVPPSSDGPAGQSERTLVRAALTAGASRIVYVSSTGVYPAGTGGWTDESVPPSPLSSHGERRLECETALLDEAKSAGISAVSLRAAGIYGPGRGVVTRMLSGTYRVVGDGNTYVSRVHVRDLATAILAAGTVTNLTRPIYNVADDEPTTARAFADAVSEKLSMPKASTIAPDKVSAMRVAMACANRKISNRALKTELGVSLRYPTWREGLAQLVHHTMEMMAR